MSPRWEIDKTENFPNFQKLFTNKYAMFFMAFWHPTFEREKPNEVTEHMKHTAMTVTCTLGKIEEEEEIYFSKQN